ncbi:hypothetical protein KHA80_00585 [Anaerobacillus sp. HL2]|nr:hypothetical protein KHA80_00585 [Anaerobacillus sp. HL2]
MGSWRLATITMAITKSARNRRGEVVPVDLSVLTRWQIIDNLRRSLLPPVYFAILLLAAFTVLPGSPLIWLGIVLATLFLPVIKQILSGKSAGFIIQKVLVCLLRNWANDDHFLFRQYY